MGAMKAALSGRAPLEPLELRVKLEDEWVATLQLSEREAVQLALKKDCTGHIRRSLHLDLSSLRADETEADLALQVQIVAKGAVPPLAASEPHRLRIQRSDQRDGPGTRAWVCLYHDQNHELHSVDGAPRSSPERGVMRLLGGCVSVGELRAGVWLDALSFARHACAPPSPSSPSCPMHAP